jgi:hypothetical protein
MTYVLAFLLEALMIYILEAVMIDVKPEGHENRIDLWVTPQNVHLLQVFLG